MPRTRQSIARTMQRRARGFRPDNPSSLDELKKAFMDDSIVEAYGTVQGDIFYDGTVEENGFAFCVFSIKHVVRQIGEHIPPHRRNILVDGTFQIVPRKLPFSQVLIINVQYFSQVFPFAFVLMHDKSQESYAAIFRFVHENVMPLECQCFTSDYELAMRNAFRALIRSAKHVACHFHFCQAVKRVAHKLGLQRVLNTDSNALNLYQRLQSLPLLPENYIFETFHALSAESLKLKTHQNEWAKFIAYYNRQWIRKETPQRISVNNASMRTTSAVESLNHRLSLSVTGRAGFFQFMKALIKEATSFCEEFDHAIRDGGKIGSTEVKQYRFAGNLGIPKLF